MARFLKVFLIAFGGVAATALIAGGIIYYLATSPGRGPMASTTPAGASTSAPTSAPTTPSAEAVQQQAQSLDNKLATLQAQVAQAQQATTPQPFHLEVTQEEATAAALRNLPQINQQLKGSGMTISSLQITFSDSRVKGNAQADISGFKPTIYVEGSVKLDAGKPSLVVDKVDLGILPLPAAAEDQIRGMVQDMFAQLIQVAPNVQVQTVTVANGKLTLDGVILPGK